METGAALCASVVRQRRTIRRSLRRRKLHILRSRLKPRAQSFRCSSSPNECDSHSLGTLHCPPKAGNGGWPQLYAFGGQFGARSARSIFGDVHAAAENDCSPFRAHRARNSARLFRQAEGQLYELSFFIFPHPKCRHRFDQSWFVQYFAFLLPVKPTLNAQTCR